MTTTTVKPKDVTDELFEATLRQVVAENPDFVYPHDPSGIRQDAWHGFSGACVYALEDGTPACVIGHVVYRLTPELLPPYGTGPESATSLLARLYPNLSEGTQEMAAWVQSRQDRGGSWQKALDSYNKQWSTK